LSGGGAGALSAIGVIEELERAGIHIDCVAGTSAGAAVGAAFAAGRLEAFRARMTSMTRTRLVTSFDPVLSGPGLIAGRRAMEYIQPYIGGLIEDLPLPYAAVATDLDSGEEIVIDRGPVRDAVRASIAIPGILTPKERDGRLLIDGGLTNPLPTSVARALGADFVIAVTTLPLEPDSPAVSLRATVVGRLRGDEAGEEEAERPGLFDVLAKSSRLIQARIARTRLRESPPDALIHVPFTGIGLMEFDRVAEAVEKGHAAGRDALPRVLTLMGLAGIHVEAPEEREERETTHTPDAPADRPPVSGRGKRDDGSAA
jgi:NTE family protein